MLVSIATMIFFLLSAFFITAVLVYSAAFKAFADGDENENESLQILISQAVKNLSMIEDEDGDDKSACGHE